MLFRSTAPYRRTSRYSRPSRLRFIPLIILLLAIYDLCSTLTAPPVRRVRVASPAHEGSSASLETSKSKTNSKPQRIFIASIHWNKEALLRSHWNTAVLNLVHHFGPSNVYISILEGGSWDNTRAALSELDVELGRLGVERSIIFDDRTHQQEVERVPAPGEQGWVWTSRGMKELRRIPYLADLRNRVMSVLRTLAMKEGSEKRVFDKVLWLNDVVFTPEDVETLLQTRNGDYAAACSMDFDKPPLYYDTFALRDINGNEPIMQEWPYFDSYESRHALFSNKPVPVQSCWNGIVFFNAQPFYDDPSLNFRGIPDSLAADQLEGSECCLIHVDNKHSRKAGVWLNPNVRVGYNIAAYEAVNPAGGDFYPHGWERVRAVWRNRRQRLYEWADSSVKRYMIRSKVKAWEKKEGSGNGGVVVGERGLDCLVNEMQVLTANGWAHV